MYPSATEINNRGSRMPSVAVVICSAKYSPLLMTMTPEVGDLTSILMVGIATLNFAHWRCCR